MLERLKNIGGRSRRAFTLIELLIVIGIIGFLIAILVPVFKSQNAEITERQLIKSLESALVAYEYTFKAYPPSNYQTLTGYPNTTGITTGAQCLYYFLMGPYEHGWNNTKNNDGTSNGPVPAQYAWPPADIGPQFIGGGPGNTVAAKYFTGDPTGNADRAILYWRANAKPLSVDSTTGLANPRVAYTDVYTMGDNNDNGTGVFWTPTDVSSSTPGNVWRTMIATQYTVNSVTVWRPYNATSYLLLGAGEDRTFGYVDGYCDDPANWNRH